jgi:hypothetical protein
MADVKISGLPASTVPLAGTEVLPIVQGGATKQVANNDLRPKQIQSNATSGVLQVTGPGAAATRVMTTPDANFTAARTDAAQSLTGDQTLATGNIVQGTAAKGVNFTANTPLAGMTSQLLNWYEEGTWTPNQGAGLTVSGTFSSTGKYTRIGRQVTIQAEFTGSVSIAVAAAGAVCSNLPINATAFGSTGGMINGTLTAGVVVYAVNLVVLSSAAIAPTSALALSITYIV